MRHPPQVIPRPHADLVAHLVRSTPLTEGEADRVLAEVFDWFAGVDLPVVVGRRGAFGASPTGLGDQLRRGLHDDQVFGAIAVELPARLFPAPGLSARQLRRLVYG